MIGLLSLINVSIINTMFGNIINALLLSYCIDKEHLTYTRKMLHFNKDPEYKQIPREPLLNNKKFLHILLKFHLEHYQEKQEISEGSDSHREEREQNQQTDNRQVKIQANDNEDHIPKKKKYHKTVIMNSNVQKKPEQNPAPQRFVENYSLPKVNDIIRGSSPSKHVWYIEEKGPVAASKNRLGQGNSPFREPPFSDLLRQQKDMFNFQKENPGGINLNVDLKIDENP